MNHPAGHGFEMAKEIATRNDFIIPDCSREYVGRNCDAEQEADKIKDLKTLLASAEVDDHA